MRNVVSAIVLAACVPLAAHASGADWPSRDGDAAGTRYSTLQQITPTNVSQLTTAWTFDTGSPALQLTPVVVNGVMYFGAGSSVYALEPETAKVLWKSQFPSAVTRRGLAYWPGSGSTPARLFFGAGDRLVAIDAKTGAAIPSFGDNGSVDLKTEIRGDVDGRIALLSPPAVYKNIIITGGNNGEQAPSLGLYGDIRGWDAVTGKLLWAFHTVPRPGEPGIETWEGDSWKSRSGTNMWSFFTVDVDRGLVFVPTGSPTSDYYGGDRRGNNLYGNSVIALDATTGKLKWARQLIHHDLWDFDVPAAPTLIEVTRNGRRIPAVAAMSKAGLLFIFNRETGEPLYGMEERPVPKSNVPGEASSPTQPFPLKPAPLAKIDFDPARDMYSLTPEHAAYCKDLWDNNHLYTKGPFTPADVDNYMVTFPSTLGGANWNGFSYDPQRGLLFTNIMDLGQVGQMKMGVGRQGGPSTWVRNTPWGGAVGRFWNPMTQIPCSNPPFGELVAVDVNRGEIAWKVPVGFVDQLKARGFDKTGALNIGGSIVTAGGVIFIGATTDKRFRAFDESGKQLWETTLEASAHAIPMTFMGKDGRQYVVVAAGGGSFLGSPTGTKIVAFALPQRTAETRSARK
jgi:quinoprotein glucose dehydrogenase